jgi:hypothetical protein
MGHLTATTSPGQLQRLSKTSQCPLLHLPTLSPYNHHSTLSQKRSDILVPMLKHPPQEQQSLLEPSSGCISSLCHFWNSVWLSLPSTSIYLTKSRSIRLVGLRARGGQEATEAGWIIPCPGETIPLHPVSQNMAKTVLLCGGPGQLSIKAILGLSTGRPPHTHTDLEPPGWSLGACTLRAPLVIVKHTGMAWHCPVVLKTTAHMHFTGYIFNRGVVTNLG